MINRTFMAKRLEIELKKCSTLDLNISMNQGLSELIVLIDKKPAGWREQIDLIEKTLRMIKDELISRGEI